MNWVVKSSAVSPTLFVLKSLGLTLTPLCDAVSQFTLFARTVKGTKPDFHRAMGGDQARVIYDAFLKRLGDQYKPERIKGA